MLLTTAPLLADDEAWQPALAAYEDESRSLIDATKAGAKPDVLRAEAHSLIEHAQVVIAAFAADYPPCGPYLGAALGVVAVIVRHEIVLFIMGGLFVLETVSVILQVASYRMTGRRIFRMAPIHHHFELKGWPEPRVIVRFWIITLVLVLIGLSTLKLR